jgi:hypothetical protein
VSQSQISKAACQDLDEICKPLPNQGYPSNRHNRHTKIKQKTVIPLISTSSKLKSSQRISRELLCKPPKPQLSP